MIEDERPRPQLEALLQAAHLSADRCPNQRLVLFPGAYRDWAFAVELDDDGLTASAHVCGIPPASKLKAELFEAMLRFNGESALVKLSLADRCVRIEAKLPAQLLDGESVGNTLNIMFEAAEEHYPKLYRIVSGEDVLKSLGNYFGFPSGLGLERFFE